MKLAVGKLASSSSGVYQLCDVAECFKVLKALLKKMAKKEVHAEALRAEKVRLAKVAATAAAAGAPAAAAAAAAGAPAAAPLLADEKVDYRSSKVSDFLINVLRHHTKQATMRVHEPSHVLRRKHRSCATLRLGASARSSRCGTTR